MSEYDMRGKVCKTLRALDAISVENSCYPGTPDVNYVEGWLELKWLRKWPDNINDIVAIVHFTQQQRVWLYRRWRAGGDVYLLLQVKRDWLLFTGEQAYDVGRLPRKALRKRASQYWNDGLVGHELVNVLRHGRYATDKINKPGTAAGLETSEELASASGSEILQDNPTKILSVGARPGPFARGLKNWNPKAS